MKKLLTGIMCAVLLSACGSGLDGTFKDASGMASYKFEKGGKLTTEAMGVQMETKYELDGENIKIDVPNGGNAKMIMKLVDKNTIQGPMGIKLVKAQ